MSFFETPKLQNVVLQRELPNQFSDKLSSHPIRNRLLSELVKTLENYYLRINNNMTVQEYSFASHMHIPSYVSNDRGYFRVYDGGSDRLVVVVPQRMGAYGYNFARLVASYLASNGFYVYDIVRPLHEKRLPDGVVSTVQLPVDIQLIKSVSKQSVEEVLGLIDLVADGKVGIVGISQGAAYACIASGLEPRIKSSAYIHGFGGIANMLLYSDERFARHFREEELKRKNKINEQLVWEELREVDPLSYAKSSKSDVIMINARKDKSVPQRNIVELWKALGKPELHMFNGGHLSIALHTKRILEIILEHFEITL